MNSILRILFIVILLVLYETPSGQDLPRYTSLFKQAETLYYDRTQDPTKDSIALDCYLKVLSLHSNQPDSILWVSNFKAGIYLQTAGKVSEAIPYFKNAVSLYGLVPTITEDLFFLPNLYLGNLYYSSGIPDSAVYYYSQAEKIASRFPQIEGQESMVKFKKNLASSLRHLKKYDEAMLIYNALLKPDVNRDEILYNIGTVYFEQGKDSLAVVYLQKSGYNDQKKLNDLGTAFARLHMMDSSLAYFRKAVDFNAKRNGTRKNTAYAITCKSIGDHFVSVQNYDSALINYQRSIIQLVYDFEDEDIRLNPSAFNGQYTVNELFGALSAKAKTFIVRYHHQHTKNDLLASIYAYEALYKLADHVIRTYSSNESRLMLTSKNYLNHNEPVDISLKLFDLTGDSVYLRHAFRFGEKSKAVILALQCLETIARQKADLPGHLVREERNLKQEITRMQLTTPDSAMDSLLRDKQIRLSDLHKKFDEYPAYGSTKFISNTIDVKTLQSIIPEDYAVLSYHLGDTSLVGIVITKGKYGHAKESIDSSFINSIRKLYQQVKLTGQQVNVQIEQFSDTLYRKLIMPFSAFISPVRHLMIVPGDELSYLPFEILGIRGKKKLVESWTVTYNYSCSQLKQAKKNNHRTSVFAMAPFVKTLPASALEIRDIDGERIAGESATKKKFVEMVEKYSVIHLATPARANDIDPARSYIEFYPDDSSYHSSKLFTGEVAALDLRNANVMILSACETPVGKFAKGEGLMSLTNAISRAGCNNTIASLWKADDRATASISRSLHNYISEGKTLAEALQQAKIDYLSEVPGRLTPPASWAHLRLIGGFEKSKSSKIYLLVIASALVFIAGLIYFARWRS